MRAVALVLVAMTMTACASGAPRPSTAEILDLGPEFSPDGSSIVFTSDRSGTQKVYVVDLDTLGVAPLAPGSSLDLSATWMPNGEAVLYIERRENNDQPISELRGVTPDNEHVDITPAEIIEAQPDMTATGEVVFACGNNDQYDVCIRDLDLTLLAVVVEDVEARDWLPAWSPDASKVAYTSDTTGNDDLWIVDMADGTRTQLTNLGVDETDAAWSPDGTLIAYTRRGSSLFDEPEVWIMEADGDQKRMVTEGSAPSWSPDGTSLALVRTPELPQRGTVIEIINLETSERRQVSR